MTIHTELTVRCDEPGCINTQGPFHDKPALRRWLRSSSWAEIVVRGRTTAHRCPDHPGGAGVREPRRTPPDRPREHVRQAVR